MATTSKKKAKTKKQPKTSGSSGNVMTGLPLVSQGPPGPGPVKFRVRAYQAGFGESLLLSFIYAKASQTRHVLVDFGTVRLPAGAPSNQLTKIANDIKSETGGKLYAVVETHRHRDHISGFTNSKPADPGAIIAALKPTCVLSPWTENPAAASGATSAPEYDGAQQFARMLLDMQSFAQRASSEAAAFAARSPATAGELGLVSKNNVPNQSAVNNLQKMAVGKGKWNGHEYLSYGVQTRLVEELPGVTVRVLGPPTLEESQAIKKESTTNPSEFWQLQRESLRQRTEFWRMQGVAAAKTGGDLQDASPFASLPSWKYPHPENVRWFMERADSIRTNQLLELVRVLDDAMNNTSLILLFEMGGQRFLFTGDAQWENWEYALAQNGVLDLLHGVRLYKVGHHGSRNATPKSMWNEVKKYCEPEFATVVSTMPGVYGNPAKHTEVPRGTLIDELRGHSEFHTTEGQHALYEDIVFSLT